MIALRGDHLALARRLPPSSNVLTVVETPGGSRREELHDLSDAERAWLVAYCEKKTARYASLLSAVALQAMREALFESLAIHPGTHDLIRRLAPPPIVLKSGEVGEDGAAVEEDVQQRRPAGRK